MKLINLFEVTLAVKPEEIERRLKVLRTPGMSLGNAAKTLGMSYSGICQFARQHLPKDELLNNRVISRTETERRLAILREPEMTMNKAAKKVGVNPDTLAIFAKKNMTQPELDGLAERGEAERREGISGTWKRRLKDPEFAKHISDTIKTRWADLGGFETWIKQFSPEKQEEIVMGMRYKDLKRNRKD